MLKSDWTLSHTKGDNIVLFANIFVAAPAFVAACWPLLRLWQRYRQQEKPEVDWEEAYLQDKSADLWFVGEWGAPEVKIVVTMLVKLEKL